MRLGKTMPRRSRSAAAQQFKGRNTIVLKRNGLAVEQAGAQRLDGHADQRERGQPVSRIPAGNSIPPEFHPH